ncbi:hypothetical protein WNZ14_12235 [Hoeflea sp. AS60]|uniref:hypothetical protein n=1 Tax=Hoeflea sp. AS60 TaxID=3135780 RepID=UPI0031797C23
MPDNLLGGQGATLLTAIIIVAVALLALVGVFWLIRNRAASTFIRGGKNRLPRLAVLDATAVDTRRRLVLIRRDDVEHLVMIGGPTDIVIESRIQHGDHGRAPQPADHAAPSPTPQREPRVASPAAARPSAPQQPRSPAQAQPVAPSLDSPARRPEVAPQPGTRQQPSVSAPAMAATAATAGAASSIRTEAADLLETVRTRVFEEPSFDEADFDDLTVAPARPAQMAPAPVAPTRPAPPQNAPTAVSSPRAPAATTPADPAQAEAADVLENVRTRVFEEPSFDESAFDELTADPVANEPASPAPRSFAPAAEPATPVAPASSDFETVLAEELSQDLKIEPPRSSFITAQYNEHQLDDDEADRLEAPEVAPEPQPSRDSLEAEMEKLLGDLSRRP